MMGARALLALVASIAVQLPPAAAPTPAEVELRAAIEQYYAAQEARDPDKAASFWSEDANPRMTRATFVALFGPAAEDIYTVDIRALTITGNDAKARVMAMRTRLETVDGRPVTSRTAFANAQTWRHEAGGWKLLRDGPFADELADAYLAASEADRPAFIAAQSPVDGNSLRYALAQRASMAITVGNDYRRGRALFERALEVARAVHDRHSEASALHNIAQVDYFLRDYPGAVEYYGRELAVAREIDDENTAAAAQFGLATVAYSRAEYGAALGFYRDALAVYEKHDDGPSISRAVVSIGNVQYLQAEYDAAAASYRRGLAAALQYGDRSAATYAKSGLGRVLGAQGDIPAALDLYGQALDELRAAQASDPRLTSQVAATHESIGELYFRLGNTGQARDAYEQARRLDDKDPEALGRVLSAIGRNELVAGRFDAAIAAYTESRARFDAAKNAEGVARAWVGIGFSHAAAGKFDEAIAAYTTAIGLFGTLSNDEGVARAWLGLSRAQSGRGDDEKALESAATVATLAKRLHSTDLAWRAAERTGDSLRKLTRFDEAGEAYARAIAAIDRLAAEAPINPEARGSLSDSASAWSGLALTEAAQGHAAAALEAIEARRAHIRRVDFAPFQHDIAAGATADELADEQAIVREIISVRAQLRAETQGHPDADRVARLGEQLASLAAKRAEQQSRLYARLPDLQVWRGLAPVPLESAALGALVPGEHGLLVEYLVTDDALLIATVARSDDGLDIAAVAIPFDRRAFAEAVGAAMQAPVLADADAWPRLSAPLAEALIAPIASRLAGRDRVLVVPDDVLWKVPFEALLPRASADAAVTITYATSLATLAMQERLAPLPVHPSAAVLAAPAISAAMAAQLRLAVPAWTPADADAERAAAQRAARVYGENVTVRSGAEATADAFRESLGAADVLHVQAPLSVSGAAPLLSSLVFSASGTGTAADGRIDARAWFTASGGRARLLVLPDASTLGAPGAAAAMDPLAWALAAGGVSTLVLGRWPADGFSTAGVAAALHAQLAAGATAVDAWRAALNGERAKNPAPSAWAGLRLIGAARAPAPDDPR